MGKGKPKPKREKRKVVLFLVEGKSDRTALQLAISELYEHIDENIEVFFPIMAEDQQEVGGDITSAIRVYPRNIETKIYDSFLRDFFDREKIMPKDISEVIHIVDTDGVFVSDDSIVAKEELPLGARTYYQEETIEAINRDAIIARNAHKRENLEYLSSLDCIQVKQKKPKYSVYYFSCNLDDSLYGDKNLDYQLKWGKANDFSKKYIGKSEDFTKYVSELGKDIENMSYTESWEYIKRENNSLKRGTNLNILVNRLVIEGNIEE